MSCRTGSNAPITGSAAAITGASTEIVQKAFHALRREGARLGVAAPDPAEVAGFLHRRRELLKATEGIAPHRLLLHKIGLSQAREAAERGEVPDGPTWHAWQRILAEAEFRASIPRAKAAIFDIDGTLLDNSPMREVPLPKAGPGANYDEWMSHTAGLDANPWVRDATHQIGEEIEAVTITARSEKYRTLTEESLTRIGARVDRLIMRSVNDHRPDHEYKQQVLDELERTHDVVAAFDDNPEVAGMWRENDLDTIVVPGFHRSQAPPPPAATG